MSQALGHFAFGTGMTVLVVTFLLPRVPYPRVTGLMGGGWAMIPDFHWISPVFGESLRAAHGSVAADLFWFHRTLDALDRTDSNLVAAVMLAFLIVATVVAERREYRTAELVSRAADGVREQ